MARRGSGDESGLRALAVPWRLLPLLGVLAVLVTLGVQGAVLALDLPPTTNAATAFSTWAVVAGGALLLAGVLVPRLPLWSRAVLIVTALTATATAVLALPLHGTSYYFDGLGSDQQFRTQYLTRLTDSPALSDMNYADLPPYYPAGWFWLAGRVAALTGLEPWIAYKPLALTTFGLVPAVAWCVWSRLVGGRTAVAIAATGVVAAVSPAAMEPYAWPVAVLLPAAAVLFWRVVTAPRAAVGPLVAIGAFVGLAGSSYTLYGLLAALAGVVLAVAAVVTGRDDRRASGRRGLRDLAVVGAVALAVALPAWGPFLLEATRSGIGPNAAASWLPATSAELPDVLGADPWRLLLTLGLLGLAARLCLPWGAHPDVLVPLGAVAACVYAWFAASTLAIAAGTTLLAFRMQPLLVLSLASAGVLVLAEPGRAAGRRAAERRWPAGRVALAGGLLLVVGAAQVLGERIHDVDTRIELAYTTPYPGGANARGEVDPLREEGWSDALAAEIARRTDAAPRDTVVLTDAYTMLSVHPYRAFQQNKWHYASPLSDYRERSAFVAGLAASGSAAELLDRLDRSPWAPPTVFVLRVEADGLHVTMCRERFPAQPNVEYYDEVFPAELFAGPEFSTATVGPYLVAARTS